MFLFVVKKSKRLHQHTSSIHQVQLNGHRTRSTLSTIFLNINSIIELESGATGCSDENNKIPIVSWWGILICNDVRLLACASILLSTHQWIKWWVN